MAAHRFKTNLNCGNCVAAVAPVLDHAPAIRSWCVDTANPDKVLTVEGDDLSAESVDRLVAQAGFHVLGELGQAATEEVAPQAPPSYFPLALILCYLAGVVALVEFHAGVFVAERAMRQFMAGFFLVFSFFKLLNVSAFAASYAGYDVVARRWPVYGYVYPFLELALGAAYLVDALPVVTNSVTLIVMAVSSVGVAQSMLAKRTIRCACLGTVLNVPISYVTLFEDLLMAAMAAAMLALIFFR